MPETCENWPSIVNSYVYYAYQTYEIYQVLTAYFQSSHRNPPNKCSFISNKGSVNIWNDCNARK